MKPLKDILSQVEVLETIGNLNSGIENICFDSRQAQSGSLFVAQKGTAVDGHAFIPQVIEKGATVIVCEILPKTLNSHITYIQVADSSYALGLIAANFYGNPSRELKLVGVTGTNGKTTIVTLLYNAFKSLGYKVGLLSTIGNKVDTIDIPSTHTTPDAIQLNALLAQMVEIGCEYCFMEVSSHSVVQQRIAGLQFTGGLFTNITHDHLDFHKTFDQYIKAKKGFFDGLSANAFAITNKDDKNGMVMLQNTKAKKYTYSLQSMADFHCKIMDDSFQGLLLNIENKDIWVRLVGKFNAYNLLVIYAAMISLGVEKDEALTILSNLKSAEGRFDYLQSENKITAIVDYAHTPDALDNVLKTIEEIRGGNETLITVVGCGGNRDAAKRPVMAQIAAKYSNKLILTSDNPRNEDPETILDEMEAGLDPVSKRKALRISNRKEAIKTACHLAQAGDIILVAGKGHEKYQEIAGVKYHFDDKEELEKNLESIK